MSWLEELENKRLNRNKECLIKVIPTIYRELNEAIGVGGIPVGKIIEIAGHSGIGKTSLSLDIIAQSQKLNFTPVLLDLDNTFEAVYANSRQVDCSSLMVFRPDPTQPENLLQALEQLITDGLIDLVIIDSVSQYGGNIATVLAGLKRLIVDKNVTVILLSQLRHNFEDARDYNTAYMKPINEYADIRIMLKKIESIKHDSILIGKVVSVDIYKNCLANPKSTSMEIYF